MRALKIIMMIMIIMMMMMMTTVATVVALGDHLKQKQKMLSSRPVAWANVYYN